MRVDCDARDSDPDEESHRCSLQPGHYGRHLCFACQHTWENHMLVLPVES